MIDVRVLGAQSVRRTGGREIEAVSAQPKQFALLAYLLLSGMEGDGFVSRDELAALFWPESDSERARNTLNQYLFRLREALGTDAVVSHGRSRVGANPGRIRCDAVDFLTAMHENDHARALDLHAGELLPGLSPTATPELARWLEDRRQAFRCLAREAAIGSARKTGARAGGHGITRRNPEGVPSRWRSGTVVAVAALALGAWWTMAPRERVPDPPVRLAILPFADVSGDTSAAHVVDGLHAAVIASASDFDDLIVFSNASMERYRDPGRLPSEVARELDADVIVEGFVELGGDSLHAAVRILDPRSDDELWAGSFADNIGDSRAAHELPGRIAAEIRRALAPTTSPELPTVRPPPPGAIEEFLRGRAALRSAHEGSTAQAIERFERAVALDSGYAEAWAGLGLAWQYRGSWFGDLSPAEAMPLADDAIETALRLDDDLPEAQFVRGLLDYLYYWDWEAAEAAFRRSIELDPGLVDSRIHYANFLRAMRRVEEGTEQLEIARDLSPLDPGIWGELAVQYTHLGRFDEAREAALRANELDPAHVASRFSTALRLFGEGRKREAAVTMESAGITGFAARIYAAAGMEEDARRLLEILEAAPNRNHLVIAATHYSLGNREVALDWLELGVRERHPHMVWLNFNAHGTTEDGYEPLSQGWPVLDLRSEPRFQALLERMGFPDRPPPP